MRWGSRDPRGLWETEGGKSHVRLAACEDNKRQLCGTILWMKYPRKDVKNDDRSLRSRELVGTRVVWDLKNEGGLARRAERGFGSTPCARSSSPWQRTSPIFHASQPRARPAARGHTMAPRAHAPEWTKEELREVAQRIADRTDEPVLTPGPDDRRHAHACRRYPQRGLAHQPALAQWPPGVAPSGP